MSGPTAITERALGPDLARGVMLLFIALANSHYFLEGDEVLGGFPQDTSGVDRVVTWAISTFVDGRAFPLFGLLFGYGIARIVARQTGTPKQIRRLLWRRSTVLFVLGLVDALLFFVGDILSAYAVLLLVGAWAVGWKDRTLLIVAALFFLLTALPSDDSLAISADPPNEAVLSPDLGTQIVERLKVWPWIAFLGPVGFAAPFLVGLWAGRRRILERPAEHRRLLTIVAVGGLTIAIAGAQPAALTVSGVLEPANADVIGPLHDAAGVLGGFGYAALIALVSIHVRRGPVTRALAALGRRSLTFYLAQSLVWWVVFTPYPLGLSDELTVTTTALLATATWLATVVVASRMTSRGPFERLTRRYTYALAQ